MTISLHRSSSSITMFYDGEAYQVASSHPNWAQINEALAQKEYDTAVDLIEIKEVDPAPAFEALGEYSKLKLTDENKVEFDGMEQGGAASEYILQMAKDKFDLSPVIQFLERLNANPSYHSREQALDFVVRNEMPITEDGYFMAYKRIREDWTDVYSGKINNSIGETVAMPRRDVDDDPNRTCSKGLHTCSRDYLNAYTGDRLVAVKINPKDVVSVPTDYGFSKLRCCEYTVVKELPISLLTNDADAWQSKLVNDEYEDVATEEDKFRYFIVDAENIDEDMGITPSALTEAEDDDNVYSLEEFEEAKDAMFPGDQLWLVDTSGISLKPVTRVA